jgi:DNA polymerase-3 subunit epsilon
MSGRMPRGPSRTDRRAPWREASFACLDFETTGLDLVRDEVVSFGVVPVIGGRVDLGGAVYQEVSPTGEPTVSSIRIHHLRPTDLAGAPKLDAVAGDLARAMEGRFVLAWAAGLEIAFLRRTFGGSTWRWRRRTIDVRRLVQAFDRANRPSATATLVEPVSLEATAARFGVPVEQAHHALDDAFMTAQVFLVAVDRLAGRGPLSVRTLLHTSGGGRWTGPQPSASAG